MFPRQSSKSIVVSYWHGSGPTKVLWSWFPSWNLSLPQHILIKYKFDGHVHVQERQETQNPCRTLKHWWLLQSLCLVPWMLHPLPRTTQHVQTTGHFHYILNTHLLWPKKGLNIEVHASFLQTTYPNQIMTFTPKRVCGTTLFGCPANFQVNTCKSTWVYGLYPSRLQDVAPTGAQHAEEDGKAVKERGVGRSFWSN